MSTMSDRDLVISIKAETNGENRKKKMYELFTRYSKFVHKHWHWLTQSLGTTENVQITKEDFYGDSYLTMVKALDAVDVSKIKNDKWKFLGYYGFYLSNQRNSYAKKIIKKHAKEGPLDIVVGKQTIIASDFSYNGTALSAEEVVVEQDYKHRFWSALKVCKTSLWSETENGIFDLRLKKMTVKDICTKLNISSWTYSKKLAVMKSQLDSILDSKQVSSLR